MQNLQNQADELKGEQMRLKQAINEKNTASILANLFSKEASADQRIEDPRVEELLRRPASEIPDTSKLPEIPALILPGQHNSRNHKTSEVAVSQQDLPDDGIDYDLLGKDRSQCTPAELDRIRRERNRMHAKRTRDRKRLFMEEIADMCKTLEEENDLLSHHLDGLNGVKKPAAQVQRQPQVKQPAQHSVISPSLSATTTENVPPPLGSSMSSNKRPYPQKSAPKTPVSQHGVTFDQIQTLLEAAGAFPSAQSTSAVSASTHASDAGSLSDHEDQPSCKRTRLDKPQGVASMVTSTVPKSITTSPTTTVGC